MNSGLNDVLLIVPRRAKSNKSPGAASKEIKAGSARTSGGCGGDGERERRRLEKPRPEARVLEAGGGLSGSTCSVACSGVIL